jgi:hypothetical protein
MSRIIPINKLSPSTVTRSRGNEAYRKVVEYLKTGESLVIDLRGQELISISFLDEVVIKLQSAQLLDKVAFLFVADDTHQRLAQVAALRKAQIFYTRNEQEDRKVIEVRPVPGLEFRNLRRAGGRR